MNNLEHLVSVVIKSQTESFERRRGTKILQAREILGETLREKAVLCASKIQRKECSDLKSYLYHEKVKKL